MAGQLWLPVSERVHEDDVQLLAGAEDGEYAIVDLLEFDTVLSSPGLNGAERTEEFHEGIGSFELSGHVVVGAKLGELQGALGTPDAVLLEIVPVKLGLFVKT
jgi:hypothetical protein